MRSATEVRVGSAQTVKVITADIPPSPDRRVAIRKIRVTRMHGLGDHIRREVLKLTRRVQDSQRRPSAQTHSLPEMRDSLQESPRRRRVLLPVSAKALAREAPKHARPISAFGVTP